ncbi:MAG: MBL fold metallo-hydrolase [Candidatus Sungbacteria bacterium]|nr:MBL fold metallo-hydrolase [Candidatus Sungbacteria bacterium]
MHITKFGHSCLLVEEGGARILIDPGSYSTMQNVVREVDVILITHEHQDHLDARSLKVILANSPEVKIVTNQGAGRVLTGEGIEYQKIGDGENILIKDVLIEAFGKDHALIHSSIPVIPNTGFFIANRFFYPGDAFVYPSAPEAPPPGLLKEAPATYGRTIANMPLSDYSRSNPFLHAKVGLPKLVEILALPVTAPWMRSAEAVDYAAELKPKICIPVHDAMLKDSQMGHRLAKQILEPMGIEVRVLELGERVTF